ncbi:MAG: helix-turn-helix domain-containing protein [Candidatus Paceibacteria bacterium]|jgi:DNA-binding transcriptional ArsR family regulator
MSSLENLQQRYKKSLLSKKETAEELSISTATLDRLRKKGLIRSKRVGGGIYFTLNEIALFLDM